MNRIYYSLFFSLIFLSFTTCLSEERSSSSSFITEEDIPEEEGAMKKTDNIWREKLTPEQYYILREKGTEPAFTGKYYNNKKKGTYYCAGCGTPLFSSAAKYDSGSGWPSFFAPISEENIVRQTDKSHGMLRTEVLCTTIAIILVKKTRIMAIVVKALAANFSILFKL
jgi:peptide-methionine (R)-S-oxide reductase